MPLPCMYALGGNPMSKRPPASVTYGVQDYGENKPMRYIYVRRALNPDHIPADVLNDLRKLRRAGVETGPLPGDWLPPLPGSTWRGVPPDYKGDDPRLCNARTQSGRPCRALKLPGRKRCKWHGGLSTGPRTPEGKARVTRNLPNHRKA